MEKDSVGTQAEGMTEEQRFIFDLKGWLLIPGVLPPSQVEEIKEYLYLLRDHPQSLAEPHRTIHSGPSADLLDHPVVVDVLREVIAPDQVMRNLPWGGPGEVPAAYGFRCDNSFFTIRPPNTAAGLPPHNGAVELFPTHTYQVLNGSIYSPATRVVWELNPVKKGKGGTRFLSGSHKSNFAVPAEHKYVDNPLLEDYECPAGSVLFFTETVCHSSAAWTDTDHDRVAIFSHYMHASTKWHQGSPPYEAVMAMPPKRRTLFRGVWIGVGVKNEEYTADNRAI